MGTYVPARTLAQPYFLVVTLLTMLQLTDVSLDYPTADGTLTVLDGAAMSLAAGERVAITGPSGSGKTSLLLVATGLEAPTSGSVAIDGQALDGLDADRRADLRRDRLGIVFQAFHLIPSLTALENVSLPLDIAGIEDGHARARTMLEEVGLASRVDHYPQALSGGEQQRVAIARSLVHRPALLVADEPTGNLDRNTGDSIAELLLSSERRSGASLLLVTHDPALAARCDRTLLLSGGRLLAQDA